MSSEPLPPFLGILLFFSPLIVAFIWVCIKEAINKKKFFLENSRQFVMRVDTADSHGIRKEGDSQVSMEYYGKRYKYKCLRVVDKSFEYPYGKWHTRYYYILEKMTNEQPPHYSHMDEMRKKESNK